MTKVIKPDKPAKSNTNQIPYGYCHCGCGQKTNRSPINNASKGMVKGEPAKYCRGHNPWRSNKPKVKRAPTEYDHVLQMELDLETDRSRIEMLEWRRAQDEDLRALQDYVHPHQLIVWKPGGQSGKQGADEVHLTTNTSCTCSRFKLRDRCEHIAFVKRLEHHGITPNMETPVRAADVEAELEVAA